MKSTNTDSLKVAKILFSIGSVIFRTRQPFRYSSGILSPIYTDNRLIISHPKEREIIVDLLIKEIKKIGMPDVIAATATAGIPHAAFIAQKLNLPMIYVKGQAKKYGKKNAIEGTIKKGQKAIVIDDLISTGGSSLRVVDTIRKVGGKVTDVIAIFTYGFEKSREDFEKSKVSVHTLTDIDASVEAATRDGYLKKDQVEAIQSWAKDPDGWGKKMGFE